MVYIGCTQKLSKEFQDNLFHGSEEAATGIHGWHANLFRFYRRKSVLLVNDETRFALFIPGLRKPEFQNFETLFRKSLKHELTCFGVPNGAVAQVLLALGPMTLGKTHSRSVLGTMNDMVFCIEVQLQRLGGLPENDKELDLVSRSINEMPCSSKEHRGYFIPADAMRKLVASL